MTPTAQYPRSRYVAMQVALFAILLATVAAADWVSHRRSASPPVNLGPISLGDFKLHLPSDWPAQQNNNRDSIQISAAEPGDTGRHIIATYQHLRDPIDPMEYLEHTGLVNGSWTQEQLTVDGNPGAYVQTMRLVDQAGQHVIIKDLLACVMLPSGQVLTLQLTGPGRIDEGDQQLLQELLTSMEIAPQKNAPGGRSQQQWEGI